MERLTEMCYASSKRTPPRAAGATLPMRTISWALQRVTGESLMDYLRADWVQEWLRTNSQPGDTNLTTQRWLAEQPAKRHIFSALYSDLLHTTGLRILDVGGGLTAVTRELGARHHYDLVELLAHDSPSSFETYIGDSI